MISLESTVSDKPLIYSCSGCSNVAQLANDLAVVMDREGLGQMSCIAGVGGNVKHLVKLAQSGRDVMALDGCSIGCVKRTLAMRDVEPKWHVEITSLGIPKMEGVSCNYTQMNDVLRKVQQILQSVVHVE